MRVGHGERTGLGAGAGGPASCDSSAERGVRSRGFSPGVGPRLLGIDSAGRLSSFASGSAPDGEFDAAFVIVGGVQPRISSGSYRAAVATAAGPHLGGGGRGDPSRGIYCAFALLCLFASVFLLFLIVVYAKSQMVRDLPKTVVTRSDVAVRGSIFSGDDYLLASSQKLYSVSISPGFISPSKKDLFINLFSIYSGLPEEYVRRSVESGSAYVTLSTDVMPNVAASINQLNIKLLKLGVFKDVQHPSGKILQKRGIDVEVNKINRVYSFDQYLEPGLGYIKESEGRVKLIKGVKGVEKYRDNILSARRDGKVTGHRDVSNNVILSKDSIIARREDGFDVRLTVLLSLQKQVQDTLKSANEKYKAKEMIAAVMEPDGRIVAFASSNSYNPNIGKRGGREVLQLMNVSAVEKSYEPGSTIKPLIFAYLLDNGLLNLDRTVDVGDGVYRLRSYTINDPLPFRKLKTRDVIVKSSNIGMVKLVGNLSGVEMRDAFTTFGLGSHTNIDIAYEKAGFIPKSSILSREVEKAAASYGYGIEVTFIQLLRAYGAFVNGGKLVVPHVSGHFVSADGSVYLPKYGEPIQIISPRTADYMRSLLHDVVTNGTGRNANLRGLVTGGKTGTSHIAQKGQYKNLYNSSFFGYASDGNKTYVIGVVAFESHSNEDYHYGGKTAAPVFASIAGLLVDNGLLVVNK